MAAAIPTDDDLVAWLDRLSNRGRWGDDDELGTLNLVTPARRLAALAEVREGRTIGCARPIRVEADATDVLIPPIHRMLDTSARPAAEAPPEESLETTAADVVGCAPHGVTITHVDALGHFHGAGRAYNGRDAKAIVTADGLTACSVAAMRDGVMTRGVLFDIARMRGRPWLEAGEPIHAGDLDRWEAERGVRVEEGDALLVRTGWARRREELGWYPVRKNRPGLHASTLPWLHERGVAVVASDASHDQVPSGYRRIPMPIHTIGISAMGLCLVDSCDFEALSEACATQDRWACLFVLAPLRFEGATASPVTPLAVV